MKSSSSSSSSPTPPTTSSTTNGTSRTNYTQFSSTRTKYNKSAASPSNGNNSNKNHHHVPLVVSPSIAPSSGNHNNNNHSQPPFSSSLSPSRHSYHPPPPPSSSHNEKQQDLAYCIVWSPLPIITWFIPFIGHTGICNSYGIASDFRGPYYVGDDGDMAFGQPTRALRIIHHRSMTEVNKTTPTTTPLSTPTKTTSATPTSSSSSSSLSRGLLLRSSVSFKEQPLSANAQIVSPRMTEEIDDSEEYQDHNIINVVGQDENDDTIDTNHESTHHHPHGTSSISAQQWDEAIMEANAVYNHRMHNICCDNCHSHVAYALNVMNVQYYGIYKWDMIKIACLLFFRGRFLSYTAIVQQFGPFLIMMSIMFYIRSH
jgi:Protein of unknown function (DUF778)